MFTEPKVTEIYYVADDFCKEFAARQKKIHLCGTINGYTNLVNEVYLLEPASISKIKSQ